MNAFCAEVLVAAVILSAVAAAKDDEVLVPDSFLKTDFAPAQRYLAIKVRGDFHDYPIPDALGYMVRKCKDLDGGGYKIRFDWIGPRPSEPLPLFTRKFKDVPLRTFFYMLSQDSGWIMEWRYEKKRPRTITFRKP